MPQPPSTRRTTVVVGAGAAGSALAARLSVRPDREVILLEAGPEGWDDSDIAADLLEGTAIRAAAPGHPANWSYPALLDPLTPYLIARGRVLGGSSAVNGGAFVRPTPADFRRWESADPAWSYDRILPIMDEIEHDLDKPDVERAGPIQIRRPLLDSALERAFVAAAASVNGGMARAIPSTVVDGLRRSVPDAYDLRSKSVEIRTGVQALRILFDGTRAVGVLTTAGPVHGDDIVLCAGAIGTAHLMLVSGVGPAAQLSSLGVPVVADLPVGDSFVDHPNVALTYRALNAARPRAVDTPFTTTLALHSSVAEPGTNDVELMLVTCPLNTLLSRAVEDPGDECELALIVSLQDPDSRGRISLVSADPRALPKIEYRYLASARDRVRLRDGIRTAVRLLESAAFDRVFRGLVDLSRSELSDDALLDAWVQRHLGTAIHMCATAPIGRVVDAGGAVIGIDGLYVADTSILPSAPARGAYAAAVLVAEVIARALDAG